ncbi:MAG: type II secretion system F family protein [Chloroflexi bacterium]|nr:type II secretion system F family protein [Chloroflexota bacterium]
MNVALLAALLAGLSAFVGVGALAGQFGTNHRKLVERAVAFSRQRTDAPGGRAPRVELLRPNALANSAALSGLLGRYHWAVDRGLLLERAAVPMKVSEYLLVVGASAVAVGIAAAVLSGLPLVGLAFAAATVIGFETWLRGRARRRLALFEMQLPTALDVMSTSLKSGFSIMEAVATVSREMEAPLGAEFARILNEARVGGSFQASLEKLVERVKSRDLRLVVRALEVHRRVGGDLAAILESVAATMREREALRGHVRALVAQQRFGAIVVGLLPAWVVGFLFVADPEFISPLWEEVAGRLMLGGGILMEVLAFFVMSRITRIEV